MIVGYHAPSSQCCSSYYPLDFHSTLGYPWVLYSTESEIEAAVITAAGNL